MSSISFLSAVITVMASFIISINPLLDPFTKFFTIFISLSVFGFTPWFLLSGLPSEIICEGTDKLAYKLFIYTVAITFYSSIFLFMIMSLIIIGILLITLSPFMLIAFAFIFAVMVVKYRGLIIKNKSLIHELFKSIEKFTVQMEGRREKDGKQRLSLLFRWMLKQIFTIQYYSLLVFIGVIESSYLHYFGILVFNPSKSSLGYIDGGELYFIILIKYYTNILHYKPDIINLLFLTYYLSTSIFLLTTTILQILIFHLIIEISQISLQKK